MSESAVPALPRRERWIVLASLAAVAALAWFYLWLDAAHMAAMPGHGHAAPWNPSSLLMVFVMWSVMMVGMMLPSAAPAILLFGTMSHARDAGGVARVWTFAAGYLIVWTAFSVLVTLLQAGLASSGLLDAMMTSTSTWLSAAVLGCAGIYQWLPAKQACLRKCRSPMQLFLFHWRSGSVGALRMGAEHGLFCVGCCWALMMLLFAVGAMNLLWVALLTALILLEKLLPAGVWIARMAGVGLVAASIALLA